MWEKSQEPAKFYREMHKIRYRPKNPEGWLGSQNPSLFAGNLEIKSLATQKGPLLIVLYLACAG